MMKLSSTPHVPNRTQFTGKPNPKNRGYGFKDCTEEEAIASIKAAVKRTGVTEWR